MVRVSNVVLQKAGKTLYDILVCPLSKQPLRYCEESNSLISDAIGVSFPIKNGIPCLVPRDGKMLEEEDASKPDNGTNLSEVEEENQGRSA
ncbi:preY protein [Spatholobus suberectus]|nr:preY protein [Spatholobus suberectus]